MGLGAKWPNIFSIVSGLKHKYEVLLTFLIDEVDPYQKPKELLEVSPKGLVPGLTLHKYNPPRALNESTVIIDYLEEYVPLSFALFDRSLKALISLALSATGRSILPPATNPCKSCPHGVNIEALTKDTIDARALVRLQADHINRTLVPAFYRYLQAQDEDKQIEGGKDFHAALEGLVKLLERAEREIVGAGGAAGEGEAQALRKGLGVWIPEEKNLGWADIIGGPCTFLSSSGDSFD